MRLIFQTSLNKGIFPTQLKEGHVTPIHKEGDKGNIAQYRPVSLLANVSKVFKRVLFNNLYHIEMMHRAEFGFRQKRSAVLQLLFYFNDLHNRMENPELAEIHTLFIDFSKAFDKVAHEKLIVKLHNFRNGGKLLKLLAKYLANRVQRFRVRGSASTESMITSGVPQGSTLGPLMFAVNVNDLPLVVDTGSAYGYAEDFQVISRSLN